MHEKAVIAADPECQLTADATAEQYYALPPKCTRLECTTIDGTGCGTRGYGAAKESCTAHSAYGCFTYYPRQATGFQKLRAAPAGSATLGNIVAESLVDIYRTGWCGQRNNITYLIQCMEAAAGSDLTDARATTFTPKARALRRIAGWPRASGCAARDGYVRRPEWPSARFSPFKSLGCGRHHDHPAAELGLSRSRGYTTARRARERILI